MAVGALIVVLLWPIGCRVLTMLLPAHRLMTCGSIRWFDRPCPLCGLTRGFDAAYRGDWSAAAAWNPLTLPLLAFVLVELTGRVLLAVRPLDRHLPALAAWDRRIHLALFAGYLIYAVAFAARAWAIGPV